jgi:hypothetical protein
MLDKGSKRLRFWCMGTSGSFDCIFAAVLVAFLSINESCEAASDLTSGQVAQDTNLPKLPPAAHSNEVPAPGSKVPGCSNLVDIASAYDLPIDFFTRLIQQESNFDPKSVSRAGALGIAQFMPGTARWRGLSDPFEPVEALKEAARWLRELRGQFGNLGLAAAAYNAGPGRVRNWLAGRGPLPRETRAYVQIVTGRSAEQWVGASEETPSPNLTGDCGRLVNRAPRTPNDHLDRDVKTPPWGLQLIGDSSQSKALSEYAEMQRRYHSVLSDRTPTVLERTMGGRGPSTWYFVRVSEARREGAMQLCAKLKSAGGSCIVTRN